jgi:predicted secreted acid phosphatase
MTNRMLRNAIICSTALLSISTLSFAEPTNIGTLRTTLKAYHDTGAYDKEFTAIVKQAETYINARAATNAKAPNPAKLAIVLDIDETAISSYNDMLERKFCDDKERFDHDVKRGKIPVIAPMLTLYKDARNEHVAIFFVTGRGPSLQKITESNLKYAGYTTWNGIYFRPKEDRAKSVIPFKTQVRSNITSQGYTIVASIGDQASDLTGGYAEKTFKLPNPYYYVP